MAARRSSVIMQPTTLCNLNCSYCYLPFRRHVRRMPLAVAQAVAASIVPWTERAAVEVCWHGGEPLTAGPAHLGRLMDCFAGLDVVHGVQTNATLVDEAWAEFFLERGVRVGVSIDGPPEDNQQRVDWAGRSAFDRIVRGIRLLVTREMTVSVIAVVSDPTPERARKLYTFVADLGAAWLGVNIEEREGSNNRRTAPPESQVADFWAALIAAWQANPTVKLREADRALSYARNFLNGERNCESAHRLTPLDPLPTIAWNGEVTLISPELAGFRSDRYGDFSCGNVLRTPLDRHPNRHAGGMGPRVPAWHRRVSRNLPLFRVLRRRSSLEPLLRARPDGRHRNRLLSQQQNRSHRRNNAPYLALGGG
ncbi:MAG: radical SAM protein [Pseudonocardiaceae bacterium]